MRALRERRTLNFGLQDITLLQISTDFEIDLTYKLESYEGFVCSQEQTQGTFFFTVYLVFFLFNCELKSSVRVLLLLLSHWALICKASEFAARAPVCRCVTNTALRSSPATHTRPARWPHGSVLPICATYPCPCMQHCQLHPTHAVLVIDLQAFFLWHHSKDCIQVQHNLTRYEKGGKNLSASLEKLFLSVCCPPHLC